SGYLLSRNVATCVPAVLTSDLGEQRSGLLFGGVALALIVSAATLAAAVPLQFSIATVFLFAGPHNWIEARYFLSRTPARWGKLRIYFGLAFAGIFGLTAIFAALPWLGQEWDAIHWSIALSTWDSLLVLWILAL